jgi:hypothetical protein
MLRTRLALFVSITALATFASGQRKAPLDKRADRAIEAGLSWLVRHQGADGSWSGKTMKKACRDQQQCSDGGDEERDIYGEGLTALAVLVFLREGVSPTSTRAFVDPLDGQTYVGGEVVTRGLAWLKEARNADGSFARYQTFLYNHCLATLAFTEAARATKDPALAEIAQHGLRFLEGAQKPAPDGEGLWGWRYAPRQTIEAEKTKLGEAKYKEQLYDADSSVTGWAALVLHAGREAGLDVHDENVAGARRFLDVMTRLDGKVGYLDAERAGMKVEGERDSYDYHSGTLSSLGIHVHVLAGTDRKHVFFQRASTELLEDLPRVSSSQKSIDYYYWYQGTLALDALQRTPKGKYVKQKSYLPWFTATAEALVGLASTDEKSCARGGWLVHDRWCHTGGPVYATTFAVLTLQLCRATL